MTYLYISSAQVSHARCANLRSVIIISTFYTLYTIDEMQDTAWDHVYLSIILETSRGCCVSHET
jgi:hypothetical protein